MCKKVLLLIVLCLALTACGSKTESIEGYWMDENGETISFNSNGKAIVDGMSFDYSSYGENNVSLSLWAFTQVFRFDINSDVLTLTNLSDNTTRLLYRDEQKQADIKEKLVQEVAGQG